MSNIYKAFEKGKAFIGFLTAGDPDLETTKECIFAMEQAGADLIEIGIPFSDPIAEGIVIQNANIRALNSGTNLDKIFKLVKEIREKTSIPLVFLTYINPVFNYGYERFFKTCNNIGIDGLIIPDLPFEERSEIQEIAEKYNVDIISLIAPTSNDRIKEIAKSAKGFVYVVSSMGVTGVRKEITTDVKSIVKLVKETTTTPCAIGFGISTPEQAKHFSQIADGVIVGSAIVKIIEKYGKSAPRYVQDYVKQMKEAIQRNSLI
ncbi:MAG: tryptophan synthase subunit alpha [Candidatus Gastranaerophilales bacterium]|nr:tryptophan synthase subunit alpha [Candidatus Gastranaerophilales bacterium]